MRAPLKLLLIALVGGTLCVALAGAAAATPAPTPEQAASVQAVERSVALDDAVTFSGAYRTFGWTNPGVSWAGQGGVAPRPTADHPAVDPPVVDQRSTGDSAGGPPTGALIILAAIVLAFYLVVVRGGCALFSWGSGRSRRSDAPARGILRGGRSTIATDAVLYVDGPMSGQSAHLPVEQDGLPPRQIRVRQQRRDAENALYQRGLICENTRMWRYTHGWDDTDQANAGVEDWAKWAF